MQKTKEQVISDYLFGKIKCLFMGHKYDEDMLKLYNQRWCDRCYKVDIPKRETPFLVAKGGKL
jgi:hypothetical protein